MGNDSSSDSNDSSSSSDNSSQCTGPNAPGLNEMCYNAGADQTKGNTDPDPIGEGITAAICQTNDNAANCYNQGASDHTRK